MHDATGPRRGDPGSPPRQPRGLLALGDYAVRLAVTPLCVPYDVVRTVAPGAAFVGRPVHFHLDETLDAGMPARTRGPTGASSAIGARRRSARRAVGTGAYRLAARGGDGSTVRTRERVRHRQRARRKAWLHREPRSRGRFPPSRAPGLPASRWRLRSRRARTDVLDSTSSASPLLVAGSAQLPVSRPRGMGL